MPHSHRLIAAGIFALCIALTPCLSPADERGDARALAQQAIDRGVVYLKSVQQADGHWDDGKEVPGITAIALTAVVKSGGPSAREPFVRKGFDAILAMQRPDGAIAGDDIFSNYTTSAGVVALAATRDAAWKGNIDRAVAFLRKVQWNDQTPPRPNGRRVTDTTDIWWGGFGYDGKYRPDLSNTGWSLAALHAAGIAADDRVWRDAIVFITRCQNRSESNPLKWATDDGGAVYGPESGEGASAAGDYYDLADGRTVRWHSYGAMTSTFIRSLLLCGVKKDDPRLAAAYAWLAKNWSLQEHVGMRLGDPASAKFGLYSWYLATATALKLWGEPTLTTAKGEKIDWRLAIIAKVTSLQAKDGSWTGEPRWMEENPALATGMAMLALIEARDSLLAESK